MKLLQSPAVRVGLSISIATGLYGVSFGALSVTSGLDFWQTMALSLLLFSGGSQFAFIGVVAGGGSGIAAMGAATLLGMRNGIYGMQINALLQPRGWLRFAAAHVTIDESTATSTGQTDPLEQKRGFWTAGPGHLRPLEPVHRRGRAGRQRRWGIPSSGASTAPPSRRSWACSGRGSRAANRWRSPSSAPWPPCWPCRLCPPGCRSWWPRWWRRPIGWFSHGRSDEGLEPDVDPYAEHPHPRASPGEAA